MKFSKFLLIKIFFILISTQFCFNTPKANAAKEIKIIYDLNYSTSSLNKFDFYDLNGKLVKSLKLANNGFFERDVNLYDLKSGIYFVSLITDEKSFQQKLIIQ